MLTNIIKLSELPASARTRVCRRVQLKFKEFKNNYKNYTLYFELEKSLI